MNELKLKNGNIRFKANADTGNAELYFFGDICADPWEAYFADGTCPQDVVDFLSQCEKYENVDLHINSGGGDAFAGIAIYNILKRHNGKITTYIDGLAASAASVIALAGDVVKMPKSAELMVHQPWSVAVGNAEDMRKCADNLDNCCASIMAVYYDNKTNETTNEEIEEIVKAETWLTAENAKKYFKNIEIEEQAKIAASIKSEYFEKYRNYKPVTNKTIEDDTRNKTEIELLQMQLNLEKY